MSATAQPRERQEEDRKHTSIATNTVEIDELVRKHENLRGVLFGSGWDREARAFEPLRSFPFLARLAYNSQRIFPPSQTWIRLLILEGADRWKRFGPRC